MSRRGPDVLEQIALDRGCDWCLVPPGLWCVTSQVSTPISCTRAGRSRSAMHTRLAGLKASPPHAAETTPHDPAGSALLDADAARRQHHRRTNQERRPIEVGGARSKDTRMTEQTVNIPLLRKAVEWAEAEAAKPIELCEWEQGTWYTSPGDQAWARSYVARNPHVGDTWTRRAAAKSAECGTCYCIAGYVEVLHDIRPNGGNAPELLGLKHEDAARLFASDNTIADVRRIAESIAGERL